MAASRFVNVSDEDISQFLEENENKNTARKTSQDLALFKTFLRDRKYRLLHVNRLISFLFTSFKYYIANERVFERVSDMVLKTRE